MKNNKRNFEFNEITESFIENIDRMRDMKESNSYEKLKNLIHLQSLNFIKVMNMNEDMLLRKKSDFLFDYSTNIRTKLHEEYSIILEACVKENIFREDINKEQIYEAIQSIIVYFNLSYYQAKKIGSSIEYLEEAIDLLFQGLKIENK